MMNKKTLVLGASPNPARVSFEAAHRLTDAGHETVLVGIREGEVAGLPIHTDKPKVDAVDTLTLYIGPKNQPAWYDYILETQPKRIIFNPGTENRELFQLAEKNGIEIDRACTLVLLGVGEY